MLGGDNWAGQLGTGDTEEKLTPTEITQNFAGETIKQLGSADFSSFTLTDTGKVFAWGNNTSGQLGTGDTEKKLTPTELTVFAGKTVTQISSSSSSSDSTFALTDTGKVFAWGNNDGHQLGTGNIGGTPTPTEITQNLTGEFIKEIIAFYEVRDYSSMFALSNSGKVFAWGSAYLGTGDTEEKLVPTEITQNFAGLAAGTSQVSAIYFGDVLVTDFEVIDANTIRLKVPPHAAGVVPVTLRGLDGDIETLPTKYTYLAANDVNVPNAGVGTNRTGGAGLNLGAAIAVCIVAVVIMLLRRRLHKSYCRHRLD